MGTRIMFYLILAGIFAAIISPKFHTVDPEIQPYLEIVKDLSNGKLSGISRAGFVSDKENVLGRCYHRWGEIRINKKQWTKLNNRSRILLIAHETGHCMCELDHINGVDSWGCGKHFMHYKSTGKWCNKRNFDKYVKQMQKLDC